MYTRTSNDYRIPSFFCSYTLSHDKQLPLHLRGLLEVKRRIRPLKLLRIYARVRITKHQRTKHRKQRQVCKPRPAREKYSKVQTAMSQAGPSNPEGRAGPDLQTKAALLLGLEEAEEGRFSEESSRTTTSSKPLHDSRIHALYEQGQKAGRRRSSRLRGSSADS